MNLEQYQILETSKQADALKGKDGWLDPIFIAPLARHTRSMIILHGRGSNAYSFAMALLSVKLSKSMMNLAQVFPDTKFIFPTSKLRRAVSINRAKVSQWFDISTLQDPDHRQEIQHEGLHDSALFVHEIIRQEAKNVGLKNVILGGLSQGCALGLHVLMSFECETGQHIGGFFGMSGWLPFAKQLEALSESEEAEPVNVDQEGVANEDKERDTDPFENSNSISDDEESAAAQAAQFVRQQVMSFPESKVSNEAPLAPIFLGHGEEDEKVSVSLGEDAARIMTKLGWNVTWKSYVDLGHWYSREELEDIVSFVQRLGGNHKEM